MKTWAEKDLQYIWHPCSQMKDYEEFPPIVVERAQGLYLYDTEGKRYADVVSSWWCNLLGHCHPRINCAVKEQLDSLEHVIFANFTHKKAIELCERLVKILPAGLEKFFFTDNGSSAIETAMKMSFQYHQQTGNPQKKRFMALTGAYHGETLGALAAGAVDLYTQIYKPVLLDVLRINTPHPGPLRQGGEGVLSAEEAFGQYGHETCALLVEPVLQMAAGMKIYPPEYLKKLRELCDKYNVHLIADEIATGYGRTGKMFACEHAGISPDIMCLSKGLTGGYMPMALAVTTKKIYEAFYADYNEGRAFLHSHTYSGNPLACAAAVEVLKIFEEENILQTAQENAQDFANLVRSKFARHPSVAEIRSLGLSAPTESVVSVGKDALTSAEIRSLGLSAPTESVVSVGKDTLASAEIRSIGLINAVELKGFDPKERTGYKIYREAVKQGVLLRPLGDIIYFNPPLTITKDEMEEVVDIAFSSLYKIV